MSATVTPPPKPAVVHYPDSDGQPMADNTVQFRWIQMLYAHLAGQYRDDANVFVAGDHLIYPVEGANKVRHAPDVYVAYGRPKGDRGSYKVWDEGGVFPQVIFEVWSPNNRYSDMQDKFAFYEKHGAEEYYILYPEFPMHAEAFRREGAKLVAVAAVNGYVSPRTGLRFALDTGDLTLYGSDGRRLLTVEERAAEQERVERMAREQQEKAAKLAAKLRELGVDPDKL
jgi:Uma2 family endonuclease